MAKRTGMVRAAIVVGSVLVASGCGHDSKAAKPSTGATGTTAAAKVGVSAGKAALTRAQLVSAAIEKDDVPGWEVTVPKSAAGPVGGARMVADKAVCQPVADALSENGAVKAVAAVERSAVAEDRSGVMVRVRLASYADGGADKVMAGWRTRPCSARASTGRVAAGNSASAWRSTTVT
ncbi:hypothetical protein OG426_34690 [Streptomyces canus]|uniref:hypothetical protein n=1 Tax=Streptomyces canus TaxID=58343 RepID=UPI0022558310|nr:hypothetical protein [Streptomyces canus]MCX4857413.1 hypothetical protein [Streptomyces canus]WSW37224.1 hypothetical protein OG426_34690 [Streptomyces canus]